MANHACDCWAQENLLYYAGLRLPASLSSQQRLAVVLDVLQVPPPSGFILSLSLSAATLNILGFDYEILLGLASFIYFE